MYIYIYIHVFKQWVAHRNMMGFGTEGSVTGTTPNPRSCGPAPPRPASSTVWPKVQGTWMNLGSRKWPPVVQKGKHGMYIHISIYIDIYNMCLHVYMCTYICIHAYEFVKFHKCLFRGLIIHRYILSM